MLYAKPKSIFSWGFEVYHNQDLLAIIDMMWIREGGHFPYNGNNYQLKIEGVFSGEFALEEKGLFI